MDSLPRVWLIEGYRAGENSQLLALAEGLGWPYEIKRLAYGRGASAVGLFRRATLAGIVKKDSSPLRPPWPELVISAGLRNEPICRWIQQQGRNQVRLVHLGRPWAALDHFDLVITTPQYGLPRHPHVLHNTLPLHRVTEQRLARAEAIWKRRLNGLPRPYTAVLVGGHSGPYTFDTDQARRLAREASAMAKARGGSLLVTTSARTPRSVADTLVRALSVPHHLYQWVPHDPENPYYGYLALADVIIVTGDSMSMLTEACGTRKPVYIFDLGEGSNSMRGESGSVNSKRLFRSLLSGERLRAFLYRQLMLVGPRRSTRDLRIVLSEVVSSGRAAWLTEDSPPPTLQRPLEDLRRAVAQVEALLSVRAVNTDDRITTSSGQPGHPERAVIT